LEQRLAKTGGRLITHACYYWLLLTESYLARRFFGSMVRRIVVVLPLADRDGVRRRANKQVEGKREING